MNKTSQLLTLGAALLGAPLIPTFAQSTWQTVDDFQYTAGLSAVSGDMGTDIHGNLYAVGRGTPAVEGNSVGLVQMSADQGATWDILDTFSVEGFPIGHYRAFASDASGRLYAAGNAWNATDTAWVVRESVDGGANWTSTDDLSNAGCADIKIHPTTGDVYAGGSSANLGRVIRRRLAGASQFTTVLATGPGNIGSAWSFSFHPNGKIFVVGDGVIPSTPTWVVHSSATGDLGSWTQVDTFYSSSEWSQTSARASVITDSGTIYVAGSAYSSRTRKRHWIVRNSADSGATWTISDNFSYGGASVELSGMTLDEAGNIFVCGQAANSSGKLQWLVRKGTPTTTLVKQGKKWIQVTTVVWITSDVFQLASGKEARANGITGDVLGNIFVSGRAADTSGVDHWIVRKLLP
ncbi:MAG: hypothetical protein ABI651_13125 [Verrucomicrobiota bacterium]